MGGWNKLKLNDKLLASMYAQGDSLREVAKRFDTDSNTVKSHLQAIGIKTRGYAEALRIRYKKYGPPHHKNFQYIQNGYIYVRVRADNSYFAMCGQNGYMPQHRLVMAKHLSRCLLKTEHVHHKNGIKTDNRVENLELLSPANHKLNEMYCQACGLKKEIRLLRWQIKQLQEQLQAKLEFK